MENIPTAEEFLKENNVVGMTDLLTPIMIEFAKLHVQQALKSASENADYMTDGQEQIIDVWIDKYSILKSYPLEKIK